MPLPIIIEESMTQMQNTSGTCPTGIPLEAVPVIQQTVVTAILQWEIIFFLTGVVIAFVFSYLYFRIWYWAEGIDPIRDSEEAEEDE